VEKGGSTRQKRFKTDIKIQNIRIFKKYINTQLIMYLLSSSSYNYRPRFYGLQNFVILSSFVNIVELAYV